MKKSRYFQSYNASNGCWIKWDREQGKVVDCKKDKGAYIGIPKYRRKTK
jgi:hypothetical protein